MSELPNFEKLNNKENPQIINQQGEPIKEPSEKKKEASKDEERVKENEAIERFKKSIKKAFGGKE